MSQQPKSAVVLLSGGLDSTTTLAIAKHEGFRPHALTFRYGQRHAIEIDAARRVAQAMGVERHVVVDIDLRVFGGSALTADIDVPKNRALDDIAHGIPITYVPARNTIFLAYALAFAEVTRSEDVFIGVNALDFSGYPDCRPEYIQAFEAMANLATKAAVEGHQRLRIHSPLIHLNKAQIIQRGLELGIDYALTHSCYDPAPDGAACGQCDSCLLRLKGFAEAGVADPIAYRASPPTPRPRG
jgi:7-cyano-7-deazaguanine synthase